MSTYARLLTTEIDDQVVVAKRAIHPDHRALLHGELLRLQAAVHPNVVRVVAHTPAQGGGFATTWAGGRTLATARLTPAGVAQAMATVASTVADLHDRGVVHGHIAPSHVILSPDGTPVLCGFGPEPTERLVPGSAPWRERCAGDVEAMGRLLLRLTGDQAELEPIPLHRFAREPRWDGVTRRSLQTLADQACDPVVDRRPSARSLAGSLQALAGDGSGRSPSRTGADGRVAVRLGAAVTLAAGLGAMTSQRAWSQGIQPLRTTAGTDPAAAAIAVLQLSAALVIVSLVVLSLAEAAGRILDRPGLTALAERATPARMRSLSGRLAGLALGASVSLACQVRAPQPPAAAATTSADEVDDPAAEAPAVDPVAPNRQEVAHPTARDKPTTRPEQVADPRVTAPPAPSADANAEAVQPEIIAAAHIEATPATWIVGPGDHLWAIAEATVSQATGRPAADAETTRYWQRLIVENPEVTDPDLVLPGQVIALPAV